MKTFIKKYYWIIIVLLALIGGFLLRWALQPPNVKPELDRIVAEKEALVEKHAKDSTILTKKADSLLVVIDSLRRVSTTKSKEIVRLRLENKEMVSKIRELPPEDAVVYFSSRTGSGAKLMEDSTVIVRIEAVTTANVLFSERDAYCSEKVALESQVVVQESIINNQSELIKIKDARIVGLTEDYYRSQRITADQEAVIKKLRRNTRTKSALIGILSGVAATAVVITIVR